MHKLLQRQIRRHFGTADQIPEELRAFVELVERTYEQADADRSMLEHSMETVSDELEGRFHEARLALAETQRSQHELEISASLLQAALDATADGLLVIDLQGKVTAANRQYFAMWRVPAELVTATEDKALLSVALPQLSDPEAFVRKVQELSDDPLAESFDVLHLNDGRVFERLSRPQLLGAEVKGRVWSFRDVSAREQIVAAERQRHAQLELAAELSLLGSWETILGSNEVVWSPSMSRLLGLDANARVMTIEEAVHSYEPDDRKCLADAMTSPVRSTGPLKCRVVLSTGERRTHEVSWRYVASDPRVPARMVGVNLDVTDREHREEVLRERQRLLTESQQVARIGSWSIALPSLELTCSDEVYRLVDMDPADVLLSVDTLAARALPEDRESATQFFKQAILGTKDEVEFRVEHRDGDIATLFVQGETIGDVQKVRERVIGTIRDVTGFRAIEAQLRQAQKMEAVGRLAGGIAHDFNNILTVVIGHADTIQRVLPPGDRLMTSAAAIRKAADRAAALTRQLLAFSRKQILKPVVVSVNQIVDDILPMLRSVIGEHIELRTQLEPNLAPVLVDRGQLDQVILNLAINARDAMPDGGLLSIQTTSQKPPAADEDAAASSVANERVALAVSDNGMGMSTDVQAQIFEPFFTTKGPDHGTGLGLSTVFGIIAQSGGEISVESEPGSGTRFLVSLPVTQESEGAAPPITNQSDTARGGETILLAEDDHSVRELAAESLRRHGYTVIEARDGEEALRLARQHSGAIHLLVGDVIMPHVSGGVLAVRVKQLREETKVLLVSGYTDDVLLRAGLSTGSVAFLQKPYTTKTLLERVRLTLDAQPMNAEHNATPDLTLTGPSSD